MIGKRNAKFRTPACESNTARRRDSLFPGGQHSSRTLYRPAALGGGTGDGASVRPVVAAVCGTEGAGVAEVWAVVAADGAAGA